MKNQIGSKKVKVELNKKKADLALIEEELKETECEEDDGHQYTNDEMTVARSLRDMSLCMKLHQLMCENHNHTLQNAIRQQHNEDGSLKLNSIDYPSMYSKILENMQKLLNNNTLDVAHQLIDTLIELI